MCLRLGLCPLVTIDILLYGFSLLLEFVALVGVALPRTGAGAAVPRFPADCSAPSRSAFRHAVAGLSIIRSEHEQVWNMSSFAFGMILIARAWWLITQSFVKASGMGRG